MADLQLQPILDALQRGDPTTAGRMARVHLADRPADGEAWFLLGIAQRAGGDPGTAAESYRRALVTHDRHADVWFNLGNALADAGDEGGAFDAYAHAAERDPGHVAALEQLARRGAAAGRADLGADAASRLAALAPHDLARQAAVLRALREAGRRDEAIALFHKVLPNALDHAGFLLEGGHLLEQQGDHRALAMLYQRLDGLMPDHAVVKFQLGLNRLRINQNSAALEALRGAEALGLTERALWVNLGTALARVDRVDEALTYLERAAPDYATDPSAFVFAFALKQKLCDWRGYEQLDATLLQPAVRGAGTGGYPALPFPFTAFPGPIDEADQLAIAKRFAEFVAKDVTPYASHPWKGSHQRVRVGYLSADFHDHATAHLMLGLFKRHDRTRFEIFAYSHGPEDGSDYRARIRAEAEHFVDLSTLTDQGAAARIHADEIDVLVDLKGYTREARTAILAHRPAPVQVAWLGYPGSMGASFIDYALVDGIVAPPSQQPYYTERLLPMPHCYQPNDDEQTIAAEVPTRAEVGLPEKAVVFCSFCAHYKIDPAVFSAWMKILAAVPGSVLWLIDGYEAMRRNLRAQAQAHGIDPDRLVFAPRLRKPQHLARHALADVFLDTFAYNAHTTMSDALWAGLPAITVTGRTFATQRRREPAHRRGLRRPDRARCRASMSPWPSNSRATRRAGNVCANGWWSSAAARHCSTRPVSFVTGKPASHRSRPRATQRATTAATHEAFAGCRHRGAESRRQRARLRTGRGGHRARLRTARRLERVRRGAPSPAALRPRPLRLPPRHRLEAGLRRHARQLRQPAARGRPRRGVAAPVSPGGRARAAEPQRTHQSRRGARRQRPARRAARSPGSRRAPRTPASPTPTGTRRSRC